MTDHKPAGYLASPYGFAESTSYFYFEKLLPLVTKYLTIIDPWAVDVSHILAAPKEQQAELWLNHGDSHFDAIANRAKIVIAGLDQEPPDNGTVVEVAWAAAHHIPVIGYRGDLRTTGEEGLPYNLMIGAAIRRSGGTAVGDLTELERVLQTRTSKL